MNFDTLGLKPTLLQAVVDTGYTEPTPIQAQAIPAILSGSDVMAAAQTGTGKTAGFTLPLLQLLGGGTKAKANHVRTLILTPTRELAAQIQDSIETYGKHEDLRSVVVFGGVKINPQLMALRKGADILVATPGRLLDLYQQNAVKFTDLEVLILDEADRMLDMGFIRDIRRILPLLPKKRQNLMFSATFSDEIRTLARTICDKPVEIDVAPRNSTVDSIQQCIHKVAKEQKVNLLSHMLKNTKEQTLVFSRTKHGANKLVKRLLKDDISAAAIHGNKSQNQRTKALADFKNNDVQVLVATDIAARGIDIDELALVINFDLPNVQEDYVHRIGRTGRAGASGQAVSLVSPDENGLLRDIERFIKRKIDVVETPEFDQTTGQVNLDDDDRGPRAQSPRRRSGGNGGSKSAGNGGGQRQSRAPAAQGGDKAAASSDGKPARRRSRGRRGNGNGGSSAGNTTQAQGGQSRGQAQARRSAPRSNGKAPQSEQARHEASLENNPASGTALGKLKRFFGGGRDAA